MYHLMRAHWHQLANTTELVLLSVPPPESATQMANRSVQPFYAQLMAECCRANWRHLVNTTKAVHNGATWRIRLNLCFLQSTRVHNLNGKVNRSVQPFLHSSWQSDVGHIGASWQIRLNLCFIGPNQVHNPNGTLIGSASFAQLIAESPYTFTMGTPFPKHYPFPWGMWTPCNTQFVGPTQFLDPNGISIGSAIFAGLISVTDQQTMLLHQ